MLRYKLPPIQESTLSETALQSEEQLAKGAVLTSQDEDGSHVTRFSISDSLSNINSAFVNDENDNRVPMNVTVKKPSIDVTKPAEDIEVGSIYASIEIDEPPKVMMGNGHAIDIKETNDSDDLANKTGDKMNGRVPEDSYEDSEPQVVIVRERQIPVEAPGEEEDEAAARKDSMAPILTDRKRKRKRRCTIIILVLIGIGIVSSAVAVYFASKFSTLSISHGTFSPTNSEKTPHTSPSRARYEASFMSS